VTFSPNFGSKYSFLGWTNNLSTFRPIVTGMKCHSGRNVQWVEMFSGSSVQAPQDIKQLQHFLVMVNFYRCFLPNCAQVLRPYSIS
jgi:hypothetical protein